MLDYRLKTFITLCETMNYRITAERLNMTQPAVTQHIHFLEQELNCKLFNYQAKKLEKTKEADILLQYARSAQYNELELKERILLKGINNLRIGATKTIGEYIIKDKIINMAVDKSLVITFIIDNTKMLLHQLDSNKLDFLLVEGFFDKTKYNYSLFRQEDFIGICSPNHRFANKEISIEEIFSETIIVREEGSGTRAILEQFLAEHNFLLQSFKKVVCISDFEIIKCLVKNDDGISFVYNSVLNSDGNISFFKIKDNEIIRELNYVYLKNTDVAWMIKVLESY